MRVILRPIFLFAITLSAAIANDGPFLAVPAGGIHFQKTDAISMDKEDLFISEDKIRVAYVFRNTTAEDFTTEVAFPLPIYSLDEFEGMKPAYANFSVKVNNKLVEFRTIERAVLCKPQEKEWAAPARGQWSPDKDITDALTNHNMPVGEPEKVWEAIDNLSDEALADLVAAGAIVEDYEVRVPKWKVQTAYVWKQTFPVNAELRVEHEYEPQIGYFQEWHLEPFVDEVYAGKMELDAVPKFGTAEFNAKSAPFLKQYDIDQGVLGWAEKQRAAKKRFSFTVVNYILTTAAYWKGPIKEFTLTIEKPQTQEPVAVSTAVDGLKKIDERRFSVTRKDFVPEKDLSVVFIHAYEEF
ncbi:MAG: DUF4424 family protein [Candidatus Hydrogenedentes bacterium]|nr:DUF4424 family protein [Candidatus Hydrogenedentota bacterium]